MNKFGVGKICALTALMLAPSAMAQQNWAPPAEIAPKAPQAETAPAPAAAKSTAAENPANKKKECRAQADAKGLHGKARKAFRAECENG
jgi:hypothetical protein